MILWIHEPGSIHSHSFSTAPVEENNPSHAIVPLDPTVVRAEEIKSDCEAKPVERASFCQRIKLGNVARVQMGSHSLRFRRRENDLKNASWTSALVLDRTAAASGRLTQDCKELWTACFLEFGPEC